MMFGFQQLAVPADEIGGNVGLAPPKLKLHIVCATQCLSPSKTPMCVCGGGGVPRWCQQASAQQGVGCG